MEIVTQIITQNALPSPLAWPPIGRAINHTSVGYVYFLVASSLVSGSDTDDETVKEDKRIMSKSLTASQIRKAMLIAEVPIKRC
jgi:hypothetical protein